MIEFQEPPLQMGLSTFMDLVKFWKACSSCMGLCIALGEKFFNSDVKDVDDIILPNISSRAAAGISPRVFLVMPPSSGLLRR